MNVEYAEGLRIMAVGVGGVFANLLIVMVFVSVMGAIFGKKKKKKKKKGEAGGGGPADKLEKETSGEAQGAHKE